jgi:chromosome partitioning protein
MQTIVINSHKGGSGKSTLCRVLSVEASRTGASVFLIDFDEEGQTLTGWHESRTVEEPRRVEVSLEGIAQGLKLLNERGADYVFIDTPPNAKRDMAGIFPYADLVLVPVKPSGDDLKSAAITVATLKTQGSRFLFVITMAVKNANITAQAIASLSHHGPVSEILIANRVQYPEAFTDGRAPQEINTNSQASQESAALWRHIKKLLNAKNISLKHENIKVEMETANG